MEKSFEAASLKLYYQRCLDRWWTGILPPLCTGLACGPKECGMPPKFPGMSEKRGLSKVTQESKSGLTGSATALPGGCVGPGLSSWIAVTVDVALSKSQSQLWKSEITISNNQYWNNKVTLIPKIPLVGVNVKRRHAIWFLVYVILTKAKLWAQ